MGRLINADKLIQSWRDELWYKEHKDHKCGDVTWGTVYDAFIADAEHAPTVEPLKTGRWTMTGKQMYLNLDNAREQYRALGYPHRTELKMACSNCKMITFVDSAIKYNYCPHCGAKMEGENEQTQK